MVKQVLKFSRVKFLAVALLAVLALTVLAACGDATQTTTPPQTSPTVSANPGLTDTPAPTPTAGQTVVVIPPATVTPLINQGPTATPAATIPPNPIETVPATTPVVGTPVVSPTPGSTTVPSNTTAPATQAVTQAITAGPSPTTLPGSGSNLLYYLKDGSLMVNVPGEKESRQVAPKAFSYTQDGKGRAIYLEQASDGTVNLKLASFAGGKLQAATLDTRLFVALPSDQQNDRPGGIYGLDTRAMGELALSPDGSQVVYTKANMSGPTFDGMFTSEKPTELWLANLDPAKPAPRQLVPNDKDYIARPLWSPDGNRVAFIRTTGFGTGAGYSTALWSVYKDGSRLAFLTGPDLGKVNGVAFSAAPAYNLRWVGPQLLAFQATNQASFPIFLHDLSLGQDFPTPLVTDSAPEAVYCDGIERYIYLKFDPTTGPLRGAYSVGLTNPASQGGTVDKDALELYDCAGNILLYRNNKGQVIMAHLSLDGKISDSKSLTLDKPNDTQVRAKLAPGGKLAAVQAGKITRVLAENGQVTELKSGAFKYETLTLDWVSDKVVVGLAFNSDQPAQLLAANLAGEQVFKALDVGTVISFAGPGETAKGNV